MVKGQKQLTQGGLQQFDKLVAAESRAALASFNTVVRDFNLNPCSADHQPSADTPLPPPNKGSFNPMLARVQILRR